MHARIGAKLGLLLGLLLAPLAAWGEPAEVEYRIAEVLDEQARTWVPDEDRFRPGGKVAASELAGARVLQVSGRGYLLVQVGEEGVWVDKMDVVVSPDLPVNAGCLTLVSAASDTTARIVRGAGEGCQ